MKRTARPKERLTLDHLDLADAKILAEVKKLDKEECEKEAYRILAAILEQQGFVKAGRGRPLAEDCRVRASCAPLPDGHRPVLRRAGPSGTPSRVCARPEDVTERHGGRARPGLVLGLRRRGSPALPQARQRPAPREMR